MSRASRLARAMSRSRQALNRPHLAVAVDTFDAAPIDPTSRDRKTASGLLVVQTYAVEGTRGAGISHHQIILAPDWQRDAPQLIVLTANRGLVDIALDAEGAPRRFDVVWHPGRRIDGTPCRLLDSLIERRDLP